MNEITHAPASQTVTIAFPYSAAQLAEHQAQFELEVQEALALPPIEDDETYAAVDAWLTDLVRRKDAFLESRTAATLGIDQFLKKVRTWWKPGADAAAKAEGFIKALMGNYQVRKREAEDRARKKAAEAAETHDAQGMIDALTEASHEAAPVAGARATVSFKWIVKRIAEDLLPDELWIRVPDMKTLEDYAASVSGNDEPDPIPGVIFERVPKIGARR